MLFRGHLARDLPRKLLLLSSDRSGLFGIDTQRAL